MVFKTKTKPMPKPDTEKKADTPKVEPPKPDKGSAKFEMLAHGMIADNGERYHQGEVRVLDQEAATTMKWLATKKIKLAKGAKYE